jgi:hypothetical protein
VFEELLDSHEGFCFMEFRTRVPAYDYRQMKVPIFIAIFVLILGLFHAAGTDTLIMAVKLSEREAHSTFISVSNLKMREIRFTYQSSMRGTARRSESSF